MRDIDSRTHQPDARNVRCDWAMDSIVAYRSYGFEFFSRLLKAPVDFATAF